MVASNFNKSLSLGPSIRRRRPRRPDLSGHHPKGIRRMAPRVCRPKWRPRPSSRLATPPAVSLVVFVAKNLVGPNRASEVVASPNEVSDLRSFGHVRPDRSNQSSCSNVSCWLFFTCDRSISLKNGASLSFALEDDVATSGELWVHHGPPKGDRVIIHISPVKASSGRSLASLCRVGLGP
jgi:hypothetical protein